MNAVRPDRPTRTVARLCIIATTAVGASANWVVVPALLVLIQAVYLFTGRPQAVKPRTVWAAMTGVPFLLWYRYGMDDAVRDRTNAVYVPVTLLYLLALYMLAVGTHHLLASTQRGARDYALACAVMGIGLAGVASQNALYLPCLVLFLPLLLWYARDVLHDGAPPARWPTRMVGRLMAAVLLLGVMHAGLHVSWMWASQAGDRYLRQKVFSRLHRTPGFGMTTRRIGSVRKELWGDPAVREAVALRVFGDHPSEYLRGAIFNHYRSEGQEGSWGYLASPEQTRPPSGTWSGRMLFELRDAPESKPLATVYPTRAYSSVYFLPLGSVRFASTDSEARYFEESLATWPQHHVSSGYVYFSPSVQPPAPDPDRDNQVEPVLAARLDRIAQPLFSNAATPAQRVARVVDLFHNRTTFGQFEYDLGAPLPEDRDPVLGFLEVSRRGHCELFASAATLLLRRGGVSARYVTGFVCREKSAGDLWVIRRKHAHAWVEAYLPDQGWVVVEPTPPGALPSLTERSSLGRSMDWITAQLDRGLSLMVYGGFTAMIGSLWESFTSMVLDAPPLFWVLLLLVGVGWMLRERLMAMWRGPDPKLKRSAYAEQFIERLDRAERLLARHGVVRKVSVPVGVFMDQVRRAEIPESIRDQAMTDLEAYQERRFIACAATSS